MLFYFLDSERRYMHHKELSGRAAVVLAGGLGTRLRSVVADRPKVLAEICGRPFLFYLFDQLLDAHISHAVLCTGYLGDRIQETVGNAYKSLTVGYSPESSPLGTAGALRNALPEIDGDQVLVLNGDSYYETAIAAFWEWHLSKGAQGSLLLTTVPDTRRYGKVETDRQGKILRFSEKGTDAGPGLVNTGIYIISKQLIFSIPCGRSVSLEQEMFPQWIGRELYGCSSKGRFIDIGTPEDYARAASFFKGYKR
jgi:NDP-sugar pyrophosphorylase family protein